MIIMKFWRIVVIFSMVIFLGACDSFSGTTKDAYQGMSAKQIYTSGEASLQRGKYSNAVNAFEALQSTYPFSSYEQQSSLDIIYAYYKDKNTVAAKAAADRYIHMYPRSPQVDYAFYMKGLAGFYEGRTLPQRYLNIDLSVRDLTSARESYNDFKQLIRRFPNSPYNTDARQRMIYLRDLFAQHEIEVAQFYMDRDAYVASANRANEVLRYYRESPQVADALEIMVVSYHQLGMDQAANTTLRLLAYNFPDSKQLKRAEKAMKKKSIYVPQSKST